VDPSGLRFDTVLVVDPHPMAHVPFIHAATLACLTSLRVRCISLSVQRQSIETEFHALLRRGEMPQSDPALVIWGDLAEDAGSSWPALQAAIASWMPDHEPAHSRLIWIGWLDYLIGRSRKTPQLPAWPWNWAGAYYLLPSTFSTSGGWSREWWKERLLPFWRFTASDQCRGIAVLDEIWLAETQQSLINRWFRSYRLKLLQFPDVASSHVVHAHKLPCSGDEKIRVGLFGQLSWRKGVIPFLVASLRSVQINPQLEFHLAGVIQLNTFSELDQHFILEILADPPANLHCHTGSISNEADFNALVRQVDVIHLAYLHFRGSSNLLTKAAHYRIPVIAHRGSLIGHRVLEYSMGWLLADETEQGYLALVLSLNRVNVDRAQAAGRWDAYLAFHNLSRMRDMFARLIALEV